MQKMANRKMKAFGKIIAAHDGFCEYMEVSFASEFEAFDELAFGQGCACLPGHTCLGVNYDFALERGGGELFDCLLVVHRVDKVSELVYARGHRVRFPVSKFVRIPGDSGFGILSTCLGRGSRCKRRLQVSGNVCITTCVRRCSRGIRFDRSLGICHSGCRSSCIN